jgi:tRNA (guanine37-N1)-methyltransferase
MEIDIFTLFPEAFAWFLGQRHTVNALAAGHTARTINYREHTPLNAGQVDDTPFGGGAGMVLRVDVVHAALQAHYQRDPIEVLAARRVIALSPSGRLLDESLVAELSREPALTLLCGRYEGFDQRVIDHLAGEEISIGRYVVAGGELPAMVLSDAVLRKLPGALGDERSALEESYSPALAGAPEYPHYTRPAEYRGWKVPEVLLSGHHARIAEWRVAQSRSRAAETGSADASLP